MWRSFAHTEDGRVDERRRLCLGYGLRCRLVSTRDRKLHGRLSNILLSRLARGLLHLLRRILSIRLGI